LASSKAPTPMFASPSVQTTTIEPGAPSEAIAIDVSTAGPSAVGPVSSRLINFFYKALADSFTFNFILSLP
jgi:hypothetical protein